MKDLTITRKFEIDAGHRLQNHESKCRNIHGHRYVFEVMVSSQRLDHVGRVIDFGRMKEIVGEWLDTRWDHGLILQDADPLLTTLNQCNQQFKMYVISEPPSIEVLVRILGVHLKPLLSQEGIRLVAIRGYETPNCWADWRADAEVF